MNLQQATAVTNPVRATGVEVRRVPALRWDGPEPPEALDLDAIAGLSNVTVARMTRDELVRVICAADLPLPTGYDADRLRLQNQSTLARLAFLARLACHNRVTIRAWRCGIDEP